MSTDFKDLKQSHQRGGFISGVKIVNTAEADLKKWGNKVIKWLESEVFFFDMQFK